MRYLKLVSPEPALSFEPKTKSAFDIKHNEPGDASASAGAGQSACRSNSGTSQGDAIKRATIERAKLLQRPLAADPALGAARAEGHLPFATLDEVTANLPGALMPR